MQLTHLALSLILSAGLSCIPMYAVVYLIKKDCKLTHLALSQMCQLCQFGSG